MSRYTSWKTPIRAAGYVDQIEQFRKERGVPQDVVAERMGLDRSVWSRVVTGRRGRNSPSGAARPSFDTVAAMADALGLAFHLVPIGGKVPREVPPPAVEPIVVRPRVASPMEATPTSARIMGWLREARRAIRVAHDEIAKRSGLSEHKIAALEHGRREPLLHEATVMPKATADLTALTGQEAEEVRRLVLSYVRHRVGRGEPVSTALITAAGRLDTRRSAAA